MPGLESITGMHEAGRSIESANRLLLDLGASLMPLIAGLKST